MQFDSKSFLKASVNNSNHTFGVFAWQVAYFLVQGRNAFHREISGALFKDSIFCFCSIVNEYAKAVGVAQDFGLFYPANLFFNQARF